MSLDQLGRQTKADTGSCLSRQGWSSFYPRLLDVAAQLFSWLTQAVRSFWFGIWPLEWDEDLGGGLSCHMETNLPWKAGVWLQYGQLSAVKILMLGQALWDGMEKRLKCLWQPVFASTLQRWYTAGSSKNNTVDFAALFFFFEIVWPAWHATRNCHLFALQKTATRHDDVFICLDASHLVCRKYQLGDRGFIWFYLNIKTNMNMILFRFYWQTFPVFFSPRSSIDLSRVVSMGSRLSRYPSFLKSAKVWFLWVKGPFCECKSLHFLANQMLGSKVSPWTNPRICKPPFLFELRSVFAALAPKVRCGWGGSQKSQCDNSKKWSNMIIQ